MATKRVTIIFLVLLTAITPFFVLLMVQPFLKPIAVSALIAIAGFPVHTGIHRRVRKPTPAALVPTTFILLLVIIPSGGAWSGDYRRA